MQVHQGAKPTWPKGPGGAWAGALPCTSCSVPFKASIPPAAWGQMLLRGERLPLQELLFQSPRGCDRGDARSCPLQTASPMQHRWSFGVSCNGRCTPGQTPLAVAVNTTPMPPPSAPAKSVAQSTLLGCGQQGMDGAWGAPGLPRKLGSSGRWEDTKGTPWSQTGSPGCGDC